MTQPVILRLAYLRFVKEIGFCLAETFAVKMENLQKTIADVQGRSFAFSYTAGTAYGERELTIQKINDKED